jgi:CRP/FNR family cyclic AMP-dependent transcriptional regulator
MTEERKSGTEVKKLKTGDLLFSEGDPSNSMFIVKAGKLEVFKGKSYHEVVLGFIGAGEVVGEMAFFDNKPRSASVRARNDSEVIELSFRSLQAQLDVLPNWVQALMKSVNEHLREANQKIKELQNQRG